MHHVWLVWLTLTLEECISSGSTDRLYWSARRFLVELQSVNVHYNSVQYVFNLYTVKKLLWTILWTRPVWMKHESRWNEWWRTDKRHNQKDVMRILGNSRERDISGVWISSVQFLRDWELGICSKYHETAFINEECLFLDSCDRKHCKDYGFEKI